MVVGSGREGRVLVEAKEISSYSLLLPLSYLTHLAFIVHFSIHKCLCTYHFPQTDIVFLEREVKTRKQKFGVEIYDLMAQLEVDDGMSVEDKEGKIRLAFDQARKDIAVVQAKIDCKKEEMTTMQVAEAFASGTSGGDSGGAAGVEVPADHQPAAATIVTD